MILTKDGIENTGVWNTVVPAYTEYGSKAAEMEGIQMTLLPVVCHPCFNCVHEDA